MRRTRSEASDPVAHLIEVIVKKGLDIPEEFQGQIIQTVHEKTRILLSKSPSSQHQGDSTEIRYAVVLEYVLRKGISSRNGNGAQFNLNVPLEVLGKAIGHNKNKLLLISNTLNRFLEDSSSHPASMKSSAMGSSSRGSGSARIRKMLRARGSDGDNPKPTTAVPTGDGKPSASLRKRMEDDKAARELSKQSSSKEKVATTMQPQQLSPIRPLHMHEISIKLQSKLHDPNACERAATTLFLQLAKHILSDPDSDNPERKCIAIKDLTDNLKLYEASCFFIAAKEMEQGEGNVTLLDISIEIKDDTSSKTKPIIKKRRRLVKSDFDSDDDEYENIITVEDIAGYLLEVPSNVSTFLKDILPKVREMRAAKITDAHQQHDKHYEKTLENTKYRKRDKPSSRQTLIDSIVQTVGEEHLDGAGTDDDQGLMELESSSIRSQITPNNCKAQYRNRKGFKIWKEACLQKLIVSGETRQDSIQKRCDEIMRQYSPVV